MKVGAFGGTIAEISQFAGDACRVSKGVFGEHHGKRVDQMIEFRGVVEAQSFKQFGADGLKSLFEQIQAIAEGLILG